MRYLLFFFIFSSFALSGQNHMTPYDQVPGMISSHKPNYSVHFPEWGKMLYEYPVNFRKLTEAHASAKIDDTHIHRPLERYYKQWSRIIAPFVQDDGEIVLPDFSAHEHTLSHQNADFQLRFGAGGAWNFVGPKETFWLNSSGSAEAPASCPWQVNIYAFDVAKTNSDILFAGTETGFVNKTTNNGLNWEQVGLNYNFGGGVTAVVIDPFNEERIWVAAGNQVHRSTDGGATWQAMLLAGQGFQASRMEADLQQSGKLLAATNMGIAISTDGGDTWDLPWNERTYDAHFSPANPQKIYALSVVNDHFALVTSNNGGQTFSIDPRFPNQLENSSGGLLAVTPDDADMVRVLLLSTDNTPLLYEKASGQPFWQLLNTGRTANFELDNGQGYYDLAFEVSPTNADVIYAGTTTLYKSNNGGQTFFAIGGYRGSFPIHPDVQDLKILNDHDVWVATDGGMTHSTDDFQSTANAFARINGIVGSDMWGFDQGWNEDIVVGGRYHNGNTAIADFYQPKALRMGGAESPTGWVLQGKSRHVAFNDLGNGWILPSTAENPPEGRFIFSKYPNMDEYGGRRGNMDFHPNYYGTILLGEGSAIWKSEDMGLSFDLIYDFGEKVRMVQLSISDPNVMYADVIGRGFHRSMDGGQSWELMPSLTDGTNGTSYWQGRTHFVVSPTDATTVYACLSNGTWSKDMGTIFRSQDGGVTWENWTGSLQVFTKSLAIQPGVDGNDVIYLSANAENNTKANVFYRRSNNADWEVLGSDFPSGFSFNTMLPFFRDSKLRVAGNGGVWENQLVDLDYEPILNPWTERSQYNCKSDTIYFDDHSIVDHTGCTWSWNFDPAPLYISDPNVRNPAVVLGEAGSYTVTMTLMKNGQVFSKTIQDMVTTTECPSLDNCDNPGYAEKSNWELLYFDSEEVNQPGRASMAFDDNLSTIWHTRWSTGTDPYPHEIQIDLGEKLLIHEFSQTPRQNGVNGRIRDYELFVSDDEFNWGSPVATGAFENSSAPQTVEFSNPPEGRYVRLLMLVGGQ